MPLKDVGLRIRIDRALRESFVEACKTDDKPAAQVLREFMRAYVARHLRPKVLPRKNARKARWR